MSEKSSGKVFCPPLLSLLKNYFPGDVPIMDCCIAPILWRLGVMRLICLESRPNLSLGTWIRCSIAIHLRPQSIEADYAASREVIV